MNNQKMNRNESMNKSIVKNSLIRDQKFDEFKVEIMTYSQSLNVLIID